MAISGDTHWYQWIVWIVFCLEMQCKTCINTHNMYTVHTVNCEWTRISNREGKKKHTKQNETNEQTYKWNWNGRCASLFVLRLVRFLHNFHFSVIHITDGLMILSESLVYIHVHIIWDRKRTIRHSPFVYILCDIKRD